MRYNCRMNGVPELPIDKKGAAEGTYRDVDEYLTHQAIFIFRGSVNMENDTYWGREQAYNGAESCALLYGFDFDEAYKRLLRSVEKFVHYMELHPEIYA